LPPSWLSIFTNSSGQVPYNETISVGIELDSDGLDYNEYNSFLVIESSSEDQSAAIPIDLLVSDNGMMLGDINQDGAIDVIDIVRLVSIILGQTPTSMEFYLADLNSDEILNIQDIVLLVNGILSN